MAVNVLKIYCIDWKSGAVLYLKNSYLLQILGVICVCVCARAYARVPLKCVLLFHTCCSLTTGPQPLPKHILHRVLFSASSFSFQYHHVIQQLLVSSSLSSHHLYPFFNLFFSSVIQKAVATQEVTSPGGLPSVHCLWDIPFLLLSVVIRYLMCAEYLSVNDLVVLNNNRIYINYQLDALIIIYS